MLNEGSPELHYSSPKEAMEQDEPPQHRFDIILNGEKIGAAEMDYFSKPIPLYQLTDLYVDHDQQGHGYAGQILDKVEKFLKDRRKPGLLVDAVLEGEVAEGMYERRGWEKVEDSQGLYTYNWPDDVPRAVLRGYSQMYTDPIIREERAK